MECAAVVRILGIETLPNVESEHALMHASWRAVLLWRHSCDLHVHARLWRTRGPQRGSLKQSPRLRARTGHAPLQAGSSFRTLSFMFALLASLSLGQTRGGRMPYVSCGPSIPSPHPVTADIFSGKIQYHPPAALHRSDPGATARTTCMRKYACKRVGQW